MLSEPEFAEFLEFTELTTFIGFVFKKMHNFACNYLKSPSVNALSSGRHTYLQTLVCKIHFF
jgi:hypothetical protein